jgi:RNA polymerase sigma factor (sigma-70 family)
MPNRWLNFVLPYATAAAAQHAGEVTDRDLLERFRAAGDEAAFAALVGRHGPMVLRLCQRILRDPHDAEDAFQATFLVLGLKAGSLRAWESLGGWLHQVAYRTAQKVKIAAARRRKYDGRAEVASVADPLTQITVQEAHELLDKELVRLPDKFRVPLVLCYLEGLTRDEAAQRLGWSPSILKSRLEQARDRLRARLQGRGLGLSGALVAALVAEGTAAPAGVPCALLVETARAAVRSAAGALPASGVPARVSEVAEGVMKAMSMTRFKSATVALLLVLVGLGAAMVLAREAPGTRPPEQLAPQPPKGPIADKPEGPNADKPVAVADDAFDIQGVWELQSGEINGKKMDLEGEGQMVITSKFLIVQLQRPSPKRSWTMEFAYSYQIDSTKSPKRIDLKSLMGGIKDKTSRSIDVSQKAAMEEIERQMGEFNDKISRGIYTLDGDKLTLCYPNPDGERPSRFSTGKESGSGSSLYVYKRANPGKARRPMDDKKRDISTEPPADPVAVKVNTLLNTMATAPDMKDGTAAAEELLRLGKPAVPALIAAMKHDNATIRYHAVAILGGLGPDGAAAIPDLIRITGVPKEDDGVRQRAIYSLGEIRTDETRCVPFLLETLQGGDQDLDDLAGEALGKFAARAKSAVPTLVKMVEGRHRKLEVVVGVLGKIGPEAKAAVPALKGLLADPRYDELKERVQSVLDDIQKDEK